MALIKPAFRTRNPFSSAAINALLMSACLLLVSCQGKAFLDPDETVERAERLQFPGWVKALGFSQEGKTLIAGGCEVEAVEGEPPCLRGVVYTWDLKGAEPQETIRLPRAVTAMAISPDGSSWIAGDSEGRLIIPGTRNRNLQRPLHHKAEITALAFSPDGRWVASGSVDPSFPLGLMDTKTGGVIKVKVPLEPVSALAFSRNSQELAIAMLNGSLVTWRFTAEPVTLPISTKGSAKQSISAIAFSSDDRLLAYGRQDGHITILDRMTGHTLTTLKRSSSITALAFSPDGRYLTFGQESGKVVVVDAENGREIWTRRHAIAVADLAYSPDGSSLAVGIHRGVFLYQMGGESGVGPTRQVAQRSGWNLGRKDRRIDGRTSRVSSWKFKRVLEISQEEYLWLMPFDRLLGSAIQGMVKATSGAVAADHVSATPGKTIVTAGGRSVELDLSHLQQTKGREGIRETIRMYVQVQQLLVAAGPVSSEALEEAAIQAVVADLGQGLQFFNRESLQLARQDGGSVESSTLRKGVKYLRLTKIDRSSMSHARQWMGDKAGEKASFSPYILDLRNNSGSDVKSAVETAQVLLPEGAPIAEFIERKTGDRISYKSKSGNKSAAHGVVVLVNERTAGSAEMLACAIRNAGTGVLVGTRTAGVDDIFGTFLLPGGDALRVSIGRFYCPGDRSLRWNGQPVDIEVDQSPVPNAVPIGKRKLQYQGRRELGNALAVSLPEHPDQQLEVGIEIALCLSQTSHLLQQKDAQDGLASLLDACR